MSVVIYTVVTAIVALYVVLAVCLYRRERRRPLERDRLIREAHQRAEAARDLDAIALAWELPPYAGPEPAAALERLRQAVNDHTEGEL
jgi:hypothetical protein